MSITHQEQWSVNLSISTKYKCGDSILAKSKIKSAFTDASVRNYLKGTPKTIES
jgi:hypothetical protein